MTTEQTIPLNQLVHSKTNVRRTAKTEGIGELAASIAAHGLRQNLNVQPSADGAHFEVVAGGRRLRAMKMLAKAGKLAEDTPITCLVLGEGDDPAEISLVENAMRTAMHPDDQFEAFRALIEDKGVSVDDVAARFGVTPAVVRQRLKLANVSPKLRGLFRKGEMDLDHVMALAISDDHAAQEAVWADLPDWNRDPSSIKEALTQDSMPMTDRLAKFVGIETYIAAGGAVVRDLFDEQCEGYLADRSLVLQLVSAKLDQEVETLKAEGWKWVKAEPVRDHSVCYERLRGKVSAKNRAGSGAIIRIAHDGEMQIERGLVDPADAKAEAKRQKAEAGETAAVEKNAGLSAALVEDLTAHRTAALRIELSRNHTAALAMTVQALASSLLYHGQSATCLDLRAGSADLDRHTKAPQDSAAHQAMTLEGERWGDRLPGEPDDLMAWCLGQPQEVLLDLLAFLAALSVDAVQTKQGRGGKDTHADQLAGVLSLDMKQWWTPSVEGFYQRLPKSALLQMMTEAKVVADAPFASVKKDEAARMAAKALNGSGWLPEPLRSQL
ncbi:MAG: ParB/RepB/Spo0J family partition protein [Bradyrhizobium sp.]|nr:ParB/RepB/Spo0J family partition protein [Bradyrhizobium sp.]